MLDLSGYKFQRLVIEDGERFPYQKLVRLDFESLDLYQLYDFDECLKKEELTTFLRLWITGFLPRMKNFRLETVLSLPFPDILKTINFEPSEKLLDIDEENTVLTGGPFNIRRLTDGKVATVYTLNFWNENGQQMTYFEFSADDDWQVWIGDVKTPWKSKPEETKQLSVAKTLQCPDLMNDLIYYSMDSKEAREGAVTFLMSKAFKEMDGHPQKTHEFMEHPSTTLLLQQLS